MSPSRRASLAPWIVAAVAGAVFVALLVVYYVVLVPYRKDHTAGQFTSAEKSAVTAASTETANLLSFRRAQFDADYARALRGTTGSLRSDVSAKKAATKSTLVTGKFDLSARITHTALVGPSGKNGYIVLVTVNGYKSTTPAVPTQQNLQVTVQKVKGSWLASDVRNVGIS
jgi:hypothetical protein